MPLFGTALSLAKLRRSAPAVPPAPVAAASETCELHYPPAFPSANIRGCVDGISGDEIRGWILDQADPNRYIKLCLLIRGQFIEKTTTCIFRKDLEQLFQSKGLHGFSFRIPQESLGDPELIVEIRLENGQHLCPPTVLRNPAPRQEAAANARKPCLLVMHIPKTAVTAVRNALRSDWLTDRHLWLYGDAPGFPAEHVLYLSETQLHRAESVFGHFSYGFHTLFPQPSCYATLLRDPIKRCISHYFQDRTKSADSNTPARHLALEELLRTSPNFNYDNLMVRMFTGKAGLPLGAVTREVLREAIDIIQRDFCYVGLQQHTSEAVASLAEYLGLQPNPLQQENLGGYDPDSAVSSAAIKTLREFNQFDLELLAYAEKQFWLSGAQGWVRGRE